jgi:Skp family chaperone for outer membrane proteins
MKRISVLLAVAATATTGLLLLGETMGQATAPAPQAKPTRVAVCDVVKVFNTYDRAGDLRKEFERRGEDLRMEAERRRKAMDALASELKGLKEGSKEYDQRSAEMQRMELDLMAWKQFEENVLKRDHFRLTRAMYGEVMDAIAAVSRERGIELVMFQEPRESRASNEEELLQSITQRKVLYFDASLDLTDVVTDRVNQTYKTSRPK